MVLELQVQADAVVKVSPWQWRGHCAAWPGGPQQLWFFSRTPLSSLTPPGSTTKTPLGILPRPLLCSAFRTRLPPIENAHFSNGFFGRCHSASKMKQSGAGLLSRFCGAFKSGVTKHQKWRRGTPGPFLPFCGAFKRGATLHQK